MIVRLDAVQDIPLWTPQVGVGPYHIRRQTMSIESPETHGTQDNREGRGMQTPTQEVVPTPLAKAKYGFLINRNFVLLAIGQAISNIGDFVYSTTLLIWVFLLTHSAAAVSGVNSSV